MKSTLRNNSHNIFCGMFPWDTPEVYPLDNPGSVGLDQWQWWWWPDASDICGSYSHHCKIAKSPLALQNHSLVQGKQTLILIFIGINLIRLDWFRFDETLIWCLQYHSLVQGKKYLQCICVVISSFGLNFILFYWNWLDLICLDLIWFDWTWFDLTLIGFDSIWFDLSIWHWLGLIGFD